jgi:rod shape-determining protein MreD
MRHIGSMLGFLFIVLLLRSTALSALATRGIVLDVLAFAAVLWALRHGESGGATFGFVLGLTADLDAAHWLGRHALCLSLLGYGTGRLSHTLVRDSSRTQLVLLAIATAAHQTWVALFEVGGLQGWAYLLQRIALATVFTPLVGTLLLGFIRRLTGAPLFGHVAAPTGPSS